jgi:hypothetical protein
MLLLAQLNFFPQIPGVPPFDVMLMGASNAVVTRMGYQFDLNGALRPAPEPDYITEDRKPIVRLAIDVFQPKGARRIAVLQFLPWQDGSVIRFFGAEPIARGLSATVGMARDTLLVVDPAVPNMWLTTITRISEADFKRWPKLIEKKSNFRAKLVTEAEGSHDGPTDNDDGGARVNTQARPGEP